MCVVVPMLILNPTPIG